MILSYLGYFSYKLMQCKFSLPQGTKSALNFEVTTLCNISLLGVIPVLCHGIILDYSNLSNKTMIYDNVFWDIMGSLEFFFVVISKFLVV